MYGQVEKSKENKNRAGTHSVAQKMTSSVHRFGFEDNRKGFSKEKMMRGKNPFGIINNQGEYDKGNLQLTQLKNSNKFRKQANIKSSSEVAQRAFIYENHVGVLQYDGRDENELTEQEQIRQTNPTVVYKKNLNPDMWRRLGIPENTLELRKYINLNIQGEILGEENVEGGQQRLHQTRRGILESLTIRNVAEVITHVSQVVETVVNTVFSGATNIISAVMHLATESLLKNLFLIATLNLFMGRFLTGKEMILYLILQVLNRMSEIFLTMSGVEEEYQVRWMRERSNLKKIIETSIAALIAMVTACLTTGISDVGRTRKKGNKTVR